MYRLYYCRGKASLAPHMLLEELAIPYQLIPIDVKNNQHKSPQYLALNPIGKIPLLIDKETRIAETAAICLYLADQYPEKNFAPGQGTAERGPFYQWLFFLSNTLQTELILYFNPQRYGKSNSEGIKQRAGENIAGMLDLIENQLRENFLNARGPYFFGNNCTVVDLMLLMLARWTSDMAYPARDRTHFSAYLALVAARPAVRRTFDAENILAPYF